MNAYSEHYFTAPDQVKTYYRRYQAGNASSSLPVLCMHGLTRNSRDFETLAPQIAAAGRTVICVDVRGRARSDYDPKPENYTPAVYINDMFGILDAERIDRVMTIGTSMGGLMSMLMAAVRPGLIRSAVLNDIGPVIDPKGLARIQTYVGGAGPFDSWEAAAEAVRGINGGAFPKQTGQAFWLTFARRVCRELEDGRVALDYDTAISQPVQSGDVAPPDLWPAFDALAQGPVLLIRGALSDLLAHDTAQEMVSRSRALTRVDVPDVGHAPVLDEPVAHDAINAFLNQND
jgi:pimeloyl-ACP methyl ester carboxylesterase